MIKTTIKIAAITLCLIFLIGCEKKTLTGNEFKEKMNTNGYTVENTLDKFMEDVLKDAYIAYKDNINIEFYITETTEQAAEAYKLTKKISASEVTNESSFYEKIEDNYGKFYYIYEDLFKLFSLVDNTYIYVETDAGNKAEVLKIINILDY